MIKETGFLALPFESFSIKEGTETYEKYGLKITLNDDTNHYTGPKQTHRKNDSSYNYNGSRGAEL